jgi:hypothetical protein
MYDVAEEIRLQELRDLLGSGPVGREPGFKLPAPVYVRFERPPVTVPAGTLRLETGEQFDTRISYFDYGIVSLELELQLQAEWDDLIARSSRWMDTPDLEQKALELVRRETARTSGALVKAYPEWLHEDYYIVHLRAVRDDQGRTLDARELLTRHGRQIAQLIRGERSPLSEIEERELLTSSMSYYPTDLLVAGWMAALIYDTPEGAAPTIQLLQYANTQLLQYRRYDDVLTHVLERAYDALEKRGGVLSHYRLAREAQRLNTLRLDITELTERTDNAIKFLSDMFYARAYRLVSGKVGVNDYRPLVEEKLRTAGELYHFMVNEFREARAFIMELMIVVILIIDLVFLFKGK